MIWKLRRRFIFISSLSFLLVFVLLFSLMTLISEIKTDQDLDALTAVLAENGGRFSSSMAERPNDRFNTPPGQNNITQETPFSTRFFTVLFGKNGQVSEIDTHAIVRVSEAEAESYASAALETGQTKGWVGIYRYRVFENKDGKGIVFVDGSMQRAAKSNFLLSALLVFAMGGFVVLLLIVLFSRRAVGPTAEAYEKQKRFITDAGHELKTPLTLIMANTDLAEAEFGQNELFTDMRTEGHHLNTLVCRLVELARMDEQTEKPVSEQVALHEICHESIALFRPLAEKKGLSLACDITQPLYHLCDEAAIRQVIGILLDNAIKYCDAGGRISFTLTKEYRHPVIRVENDFSGVDSLPLEQLFDRFYRADKARTSGGGFGIGLSLAKALLERDRSSITVQNCNSTAIRFTIKLA